MWCFYFCQPELEPEPEQEEGPTDFYENVETPDTQPDLTYDAAEQQLQEEQVNYEAVDDLALNMEVEQPAGDNLYDNMDMDTAAPAKVIVMHTDDFRGCVDITV